MEQFKFCFPGRSGASRVYFVPSWHLGRREFPVFGAVSGAIGCLGAMEAIKIIAGLGEILANKLLIMDLRDMSFQTIRIEKRQECAVCRKSY